MEDGHSWLFTHCSDAKEIYARSNWLFQQVGRSRSLCQHQRQGRLQVHLEKHHVSVRSSTSNRGGQWATIWQYCLLNILLRVKNQEPVFNILLFSKQWVSEGKKQNPIECTKEKVGRSKKKVGRWAVGSLIGLQNDIQTTNKSYSFHPCLWNGGRYSNWNRHAYHQNGHIRSKRWQWRTHKTTGLGRWDARKCCYPDGFLPSEGDRSLQQKKHDQVFSNQEL